jgi:hypothetical protein
VARLDRPAGDRLEALIVELGSVLARMRLQRIVETKRRAEARDIEAVAAHLVERLRRAQQADIGPADGRTRRHEQHQG